MPRAAKPQAENDKDKELVIKAALRAYSHRDLLPVDFEKLNLKGLVAAARKNEFGDTLVSFIIHELNEGLDGEDWDRAAELVERAREDLDSVLGGLCAAEMAKTGGKGT
jgi:hypothetical protein